MTSWEVHVPISPTPAFLGQLRLLTASLARFGGLGESVRIVATVGAPQAPFDIGAEIGWSGRYPIEFRWLEREVFDEHRYFGTALRRYTYRFESDFVLMLDADTFCTGSIAELAEPAEPALMGLIEAAAPAGRVIAHDPALKASPAEHWTPVLSPIARRARARGGYASRVAHRAGRWWQKRLNFVPQPSGFWRGLFASAGLPEPQLTHQYSGWGIFDSDPERRFCPTYFNQGVLAAPSAVISELGATVFDELDHVNRYIDSLYRAQLAIALALARTGVASHALAPRYNLFNRADVASAFPADVADARIVHYLDAREVDRAHLPVDLDAFLARDGLSAVNALLQSRAAELLPDLSG